MTDARKPIPGMWPLLSAGALILLATPVALVIEVLWSAEAHIATAVLAIVYTAAAAASLAFAYAGYLQHRVGPQRGVPIAAVALGVIAALVSTAILWLGLR